MNRPLLLATCIAGMIGVLPGHSHAQAPVQHLANKPTLTSAVTPSPSRRMIVPPDCLQGPHAGRVKRIMQKPVLVRRSATEVFPCCPKLLDWMIDNPEYTNEIWREMGVPLVPIVRTSNSFFCQDGDNKVRAHLVGKNDELRVAYCEGEIKRGPIKVTAEMVVVHRCRFLMHPTQGYLAAHQVEGYVSAEGPAVKAVMKLGQGVAERMVDDALQELMLFFSLLSRVNSLQPQTVEAAVARASTRMPGQQTAEVKNLLQLAVAERQSRTPANAQPALVPSTRESFPISSLPSLNSQTNSSSVTNDAADLRVDAMPTKPPSPNQQSNPTLGQQRMPGRSEASVPSINKPVTERIILPVSG